MKKHKLISLSLIFSLLAIFAYGQHEDCPGKHFDEEKINAEKVAFITENLDLTVQEAQNFWPLHNEFSKKMDKLFVEEHKLYREIKRNISTLSDTELTTKTDRIIEINSEKAELSEEYHAKFKQVLPIKKVALLYKADKEFRKHLMHKYKGRKEE